MGHTKTEALRIARNAHGKPRGRGSSWHFVAPYYSTRPNGPSTVINAYSYSSAMLKRARRVACMALELMGFDAVTAEQCTCNHTGNARDIVNKALSRIQEIKG